MVENVTEKMPLNETVNQSPTSSLHCYELQCAVEIASSCSTEKRTSIRCKNATVILGRNIRRQIILQIHLTNVRGVSHVSYLLQHCNIHRKMIKKGCGSIEIPTKKTVVFLNNCPPRKLNIFLKTLDAKLTLLNENNSSGSRTPLSVIRNEMLAGMPTVFEKLSPLCMSEIQQLRRLRIGVASKPVSPLACRYRVSEDATPKGERKRCPLRPLQMSVTPDNSIQTPIKKLVNPLIEFTDEQKAVIRAAVEKKISLFFTGGAGTGKSLVLRRIIEMLPASTTVVTASTGVAACFIDGVTVHSFAGIGNGSGTKEQCLELAKRKSIAMQWKACQQLIIDEISMIDAEYFEKLEFVARTIRCNDAPFGGIQLIVTGDFLQLPPVTKDGHAPKFCFMSEVWKRCIKETFLLSQVKRQTDREFIDILQHLRLGICSSRIIAHLNEARHVNFEGCGIKPTRLCTHRSDVEALNMQQLSRLEGESKVFIAQDSMSVPEVKNITVLKELRLKVGAQVMLIRNIDFSRGLSNGSRGVVVNFSSRGFPLVRFVATNTSEIEISPVRFHFRLPGYESSFVRSQLPLQLAWAISIHKSQGLTLDAVELSLNRVFAEGQAYVALSRARSLQSVRLIDFDPICVRANQEVVRFYEQLQKHALKNRCRARAALFLNNSSDPSNC